MRIACIIPTYNGEAQLLRLLDSLSLQSTILDILIVDSGSTDGTQEILKARVGSFKIIASSEFNHGGTRQFMVEQHPYYDFFVFMTQDAYLVESDSIARIIEPFQDPEVGAICGRQLPHIDATPIAQHARIFNYPEEVQVKTVDDIRRFGIKTAFMSNSFSAYRALALQAVGGFPKHVIFAEDMYVAAKMLLAGWKVAYAGNAICSHSHNYTIRQEFMRYFDMGVFHAREPWIRHYFGDTGDEGLRFLKSEFNFLGLRRLNWLISASLRNAAKFLGYKLGTNEAKLPVGLKRKFGMHKLFWDGPYSVTGHNNSINKK